MAKLESQFNEPSAELFGKVMRRIDFERERKNAKRRIFVFSLGLCSALLAFIPSLRAAYNGLLDSGFFHFVSLIFSDADIVVVYWRNFILSVFEALPVVSFAICAATVVLLLSSIKFLTKDIKFIFIANQALKN